MVAYIQSKIRSKQFTRDSLCGELEGEGEKGRERKETLFRCEVYLALRYTN